MLLLLSYTGSIGLPNPLPLQVSPLLKMLLLHHGDKYGDGADRSWILGINPTGRVIVDIGLHDCNAVVDAVREGFIVHAFEPAPAHMANCHAKLAPEQRMDAPVAQLVSGALAPADWWTNVRKDLYKHRQNATGFAILYQAAVSDASSAGVNFTVGAGGSSSLHLSVEASIRLGKKDASRVPVPVIRLDDAVDEDLWLLKMDTQGNEAKVLAGATRLFERRTVAHVFTEFTPRLLREAGSQPRQVLEHLQAAGFFCFDLRDSRFAPWALDGKHSLDADAFIEEMDKNVEAALKAKRPSKWATTWGSFDDLACANVAKVWQPASVGAAPGTYRTVAGPL